MGRILFVDACMRGPELSRTHRLCRHFLEEYASRRPESELIHRDLTRCELPCLTRELADQRDLGIDALSPALQAPAREVADADLILVGAPCWDLSFPSALKVYLEWASILGVTFGYTKDGQQVGLSRAKGLIYVTTAGGPMAGQSYGADYIRAIAAMFGIPQVHCVAAERLDIRGADVEAILAKAEQELNTLSKIL